MSQVIVSTLDIEIRNSIKKTGTYEKALRIYFWSSLNSKLFLVQLEVCNNVQRFNFECQLHCKGAITTTSNINNDVSFCSSIGMISPFCRV